LFYALGREKPTKTVPPKKTAYRPRTQKEKKEEIPLVGINQGVFGGPSGLYGYFFDNGLINARPFFLRTARYQKERKNKGKNSQAGEC
jgi:hypothetical protein